MQERGYPVSKLTICMKAMELHVYHNKNSDHSRPHHTRASQRWWVGFKTRHREIVLRTPHALENERPKQTEQEIIDEYFDKLEKSYQKYKYEPHQIYAGDEVGVNGDGIDTKNVNSTKRCVVAYVGVCHFTHVWLQEPHIAHAHLQCRRCVAAPVVCF